MAEVAIGAYLITFLLNLFACVRIGGTFRVTTKLLLVPLLLLHYLTRGTPSCMLVVLALLCGFLGDAVLECKHWPNAFAVGLLLFLTGHILYGLHFLQAAMAPWVLSCLLPAGFFYVVFGVSFCTKLKLRGWKQELAVSLYCMGIVFMSMAALLRALNEGRPWPWVAFVGSLFFIVSDSMLAQYRYGNRKRTNPTRVMTTYGMAQLMIVMGL